MTANGLEKSVDSSYHVGYIDNDNGLVNFVAVKKYSLVEYRNFLEYRENIENTVLQYMDLYRMVAVVHDNLIEAHSKHVDEVRLGKGISARDDLVEINAHFAALIANFAMYLGCVPRKISSKNAKARGEHEKATHHEYDNSFAYKLFCVLRNYTLHNSPPITGISGGSKISKKNNKISVDYKIYIEKDKILSDKKVRNKLREEYDAFPDKYPVIKLAEDAIKSLKIIHWKTLKSLLISIQDEIALVESLVTLVPDGHPYVAEVISNKLTQETDVRLELIPFDIIEIKKAASKY